MPQRAPGPDQASDDRGVRPIGFDPSDEDRLVRPYDPAPMRENVRAWMAVGLIAMFALEVFGLVLGVMADWMTADEAKEIGALIIPPTVGLAGAATGFYYGARTQ